MIATGRVLLSLLVSPSQNTIPLQWCWSYTKLQQCMGPGVDVFDAMAGCYSQPVSCYYYLAVHQRKEDTKTLNSLC